MAWTPRGAHLLLQIRTRVLNGDWEATFREWHPGFRAAPQAVAARPPRIKYSPTRTSLGPGVGRRARSNLMTFGGPNSCTRLAIIDE
jgi:hypothetical protein